MQTWLQNVVCDFSSIIGPMVKGRTPWSVHQQSLRGGGETQWVMSLFGQEYIVETDTKNYENLFEKSDTAFPVGPYQFVFGSHRRNSQGLVSCTY